MARLKTSKQITAKSTPALSSARPIQTVNPAGHSIGNNKLFLASQSRDGRASSPWLDFDTHQNVTREGRRKLMVKGRWLASNFPSLGGAIAEQADISCGSWIPEFQGKDKEWGEMATHWLMEWEKIMDYSGLLDGWMFRDQLIASCLIDGELGILLTETQDGHPRIQIIRSHRIGSTSERQFNTKRHRVIDGVILNRFNAPVGYVINPDNHNIPITVPAKSFILAFEPQPGMPDQRRGLSWLGSSAEDWEDIDESKRFELAAQKACSMHALIEHNEDGQFDPVKQRIQTAQTNDADTNALDETARIEIEGQYTVYKAGTGSRLEAFKYDRPGQNVQKFQAMVETHGFRGIGWSRYFTLDPSGIGGAAMRVEVDRICRTSKRRQKLVTRIMKRIHTYGLAKAMERGILPFNEEFWRWSYQTPELPTADRKYESDIAVQENNAGFATQDEIAGRRGKRWQDTQDQRITEAARMIKEAKERLDVDLDPKELLFPNSKTIDNRPERKPVNQEDDEENNNE